MWCDEYYRLPNLQKYFIPYVQFFSTFCFKKNICLFSNQHTRERESHQYKITLAKRNNFLTEKREGKPSQCETALPSEAERAVLRPT